MKTVHLVYAILYIHEYDKPHLVSATSCAGCISNRLGIRANPARFLKPINFSSNTETPYRSVENHRDIKFLGNRSNATSKQSAVSSQQSTASCHKVGLPVEIMKAHQHQKMTSFRSSSQFRAELRAGSNIPWPSFSSHRRRNSNAFSKG